MQPVKLIPLVVAASVLTALASHGEENSGAENKARHAPNVAHGQDLAKRWCAACHLVSPEQQRAMADAPPFATIAASPSFNAGRLALFLLDPHPKMPELPLSRDAAEDLAAYIASLKK